MFDSVYLHYLKAMCQILRWEPTKKGLWKKEACPTQNRRKGKLFFWPWIIFLTLRPFLTSDHFFETLAYFLGTLGYAAPFPVCSAVCGLWSV